MNQQTTPDSREQAVLQGVLHAIHKVRFGYMQVIVQDST